MYEISKPILIIREHYAEKIVCETIIKSDFSYVKNNFFDGNSSVGTLDSSEVEMVKKRIDKLDKIKSIMDEVLF